MHFRESEVPGLNYGGNKHYSREGSGFAAGECIVMVIPSVRSASDPPLFLLLSFLRPMCSQAQ
jgi:hypothetical protein